MLNEDVFVTGFYKNGEPSLKRSFQKVRLMQPKA